jgi:hypothetical protein
VPGFLVTAVHYGDVRVLGTVTFSEGDASIYLRPISARTATYDYGCHTLPAWVRTNVLATSGQLSATERPHISIHETGHCHVRTSAGRASGADAAKIGPLNSFRGACVGTVLCNDTSALSKLADVWPDAGARDEDAEPWDVTPPRTGEAVSLRVAVYVSRNPQEARPEAHRFRLAPRRRSDGGQLFVALNAIADPPLDGGHPTVMAVGGWNPHTTRDGSKPVPLAFVRNVIAPADLP